MKKEMNTSSIVLNANNKKEEALVREMETLKSSTGEQIQSLKTELKKTQIDKEKYLMLLNEAKTIISRNQKDVKILSEKEKDLQRKLETATKEFSEKYATREKSVSGEADLKKVQAALDKVVIENEKLKDTLTKNEISIAALMQENEILKTKLENTVKENIVLGKKVVIE